MRLQNIFLFTVSIAALAIILTPGLQSGSEGFASLEENPQAASLDAARFTSETVAGFSMDVPRPAAEQERLLSRHLASYPGDVEAARQLAHVKIALGKTAEANAVMQAVLSADSSAFELVADYYGGRRQPMRQIEVLDAGAEGLSGSEKVAVLNKILLIKNRHLLPQPDAVTLLQRIIAAEPDNHNHVLRLADHLADKGRETEAIAALNEAMPQFPDHQSIFKDRLARYYTRLKQFDKALSLYDEEFAIDAELNAFTNYVQILREAGRFTAWKQQLLRSARQNLLSRDEFNLLVLLHRHEGQWDKAAKLLENRANAEQPQTAEEILLYARAFNRIQKQELVRSYAHYAYIQSETAAMKSEALALMVEAARTQLNDNQRTFADDFSGFNPAIIDETPGILGGLFSLLYNSYKLDSINYSLNSARSQLETVELLDTWFTRFTTDFSGQDGQAVVYAATVKAMSSVGYNQRAAQLAEQFFNRHSSDPDYDKVADAVIPAYRALNRTQSIANTYHALVIWADRHADRSDYYEAIARLSRHYAGENQHSAVVQLYWDQIQRHPEDENLYERFLNYLNRYRIFDEQEKVYRRAIEQFKTNDYYDKLARFYLRQKQKDKLENFTREVVEIFKDSELADYLNQYVSTGRNLNDRDTSFYQAMYELANARFPRNMEFVNRLLNYYSRFKLWDQFKALSFRYFYADETIQRRLLTRLSKENALEPLMSQVGGGTPDFSGGSEKDVSTRSTAGLLLLVSARNWQSYYEAALPYAAALAGRNPEYEPFLISYARLLRSLEEQQTAEKIYASLATLYPLNKQYLIKAGELAIERGGADAAARYWLQISHIQPADHDLYRETATLFWDYYQYDDGIEVLKNARSLLEDATVFGMEMGILLEEKGEYDAAIDEYIQFAVASQQSNYQRNRAVERLMHLADNMDMEAQVTGGFNASLEQSDFALEPVKTYYQFLDYRDKELQKRQLLTTAAGRFMKLEALRWLVGEVRSERMTGEEEAVLKRIASLTENDIATMNALASLYERTGRFDEAEQIYLQRIADTQTSEPEMMGDYQDALGAAAEFYWRNERIEKAAEMWRTKAGITDGYEQKQLILLAGNRLIAKDRPQLAQWFADKGLEINPVDEDYFALKASLFAAEENYDAMSSLFKETIAAVRNNDSMGRDQRKTLIRKLRLGLIDNLKVLGDHTAVIDQYIEIINAEPETDYLIKQAYRHADEHGLIERLTGYYEQTAERSFKDYRWQLVLAELAGLQRQFDAVRDHLERAVALEPQRIYIREELAQAAIAVEDYQAAIEQYDQIYALDQANLYWQRKRAEAYRLKGEADTAVTILYEIIEQSPDSIQRYFEFARLTQDWDLLQESQKFIDLGMTEIRGDLYDYIPYENDLRVLVEVHVEDGKIMEAFDLLLELNRLYANEANRSGNNQAYRARQGQSRTYNAFSKIFAPAVREFAGNEELKQMEQRLRSFLGTNAPQSTWQWVLEVAKPLAFSKLHEECLQRLLAFEAGNKRSSDYRSKMQDVLNFYAARGMIRSIAETLEAELAGVQIKDYQQTMTEMLADAYYYLGDEEALQATLTRYWQAVKGSSASLSYRNEYVEKYLTLLHQGGERASLAAMASATTSYSGQIIGFLARNGYSDLAMRAIGTLSSGSFSTAWTDSKKMLIGMKLGMDTAQWQMAAQPADLMRDYSIGRRIGSTPPADTFFSGNDWYQFLSHYADWTLASGDQEGAFKLINSLAEGGASNARLYHLIHQWYSRHEYWDQAEEYLGLAVKLDGNSRQNILLRGELAIARGNTSAAVQVWQQLLENGDAGGYSVYFDAMKSHDLYEEARPAMEDFIMKFVQSNNFWNYEGTLFSLTEWTKTRDSDRYLADLLIQRSGLVDDPLELLSVSFYNLPFSKDVQAGIMEAIIVAAKSESLETDQNEGYNVPVLKNWLEEAIIFASDNNLHTRMLEWLQLYEQRGYNDSPTYRIGDKLRFTVLKTIALYANGKDEAGREFIAGSIDSGEFNASNRLAELVSGLEKLDKAAEARDIAIHFYSQALKTGSESTEYQQNLADLLFERGGPEDAETALLLVDGLVQKSVTNPDALLGAARVLEKHGRHQRAVQIRSQFRSLRPRNFKNTAALAAGLAKTGAASEAIEVYRDLFMERAPRSVRIDAIPGYAELIAGFDGADELDRYRQDAIAGTDEITSMLVFSAALALGDTELTEQVNTGAMATLFEPADYLAWTGGVAPGTAIDTGLLQKSLQFESDKDVAGRLLKAAVSSDSPVIGWLDSWFYPGLQYLDREDFDDRFGLRNQELLSLLPGIVDAMLAKDELDAAYSYEQMRETLAAELEVTITSRLEEIDTLINKRQKAIDAYRLTESVSNN